jgi:hypothetical protein
MADYVYCDICIAELSPLMAPSLRYYTGLKEFL